MMRSGFLLTASACAACAGQPQVVTPNFDTCLIENMAAVRMLTEEIEELEVADAQQALADHRESLIAMTDDLLAWRTDEFADDRVDEAEAASRMSTMMARYAGGADARIAAAEADDMSGREMADSAAACGEAQE